MKKHTSLILMLAFAGAFSCPLANAGLAPAGTGPTASTQTGHGRLAAWLWWNALLNNGETPRRVGPLSRFVKGGHSVGSGPTGADWPRPAVPEAAIDPDENTDGSPPDIDEPMTPPNESQPDLPWLDSLGNPNSGFPPNDDTPGRPIPVPAPGAVVLGAIGLALTHRFRGR